MIEVLASIGLVLGENREVGEEGGELLHGQADDGGGVAGDGEGPAGVLSVDEVVAAGLALPEV